MLLGTYAGRGVLSHLGGAADDGKAVPESRSGGWQGILAFSTHSGRMIM